MGKAIRMAGSITDMTDRRQAATELFAEKERALVTPKRTIMLGTTAIHSLMGKSLTLSSQRGRELILPDGGAARATIHPSFLLRMPDKSRVEEEFAMFVEDLKAGSRG